MNELKRWFRILRIKQGITQKQMANTLEINCTHLSAIENLKAYITDKFIKKLKCKFNLSEKDIIFLNKFKKYRKHNNLHYKYENKKLMKEKKVMETAYLLALNYIEALQNGEQPQINTGGTLYGFFIEEAEKVNETKD